MIELIYIIPIILTIFNIADAWADGMIYRKDGVPWAKSKIGNFFKGYHFPNWIRRYSSNCLLVTIWYYLTGLNWFLILTGLAFVGINWIIWKVVYLVSCKRIKIVLE